MFMLVKSITEPFTKDKKTRITNPKASVNRVVLN